MLCCWVENTVALVDWNPLKSIVSTEESKEEIKNGNKKQKVGRTENIKKIVLHIKLINLNNK